MNIRPIRGQVIVLPDPPPVVSSLIIMPDIAKSDNPNYFTETGRVVALAPHSFTEDGEDPRPFDVAVGDRVHFNRYAGKQVTCDDDGMLYLVMTEREIAAVVSDDVTILHGYQAPASEEVRHYTDKEGRPIDPFAGL